MILRQGLAPTFTVNYFSHVNTTPAASQLPALMKGLLGLTTANIQRTEADSTSQMPFAEAGKAQEFQSSLFCLLSVTI